MVSGSLLSSADSYPMSSFPIGSSSTSPSLNKFYFAFSGAIFLHELLLSLIGSPSSLMGSLSFLLGSSSRSPSYKGLPDPILNGMFLFSRITPLYHRISLLINRFFLEHLIIRGWGWGILLTSGG